MPVFHDLAYRKSVCVTIADDTVFREIAHSMDTVYLIAMRPRTLEYLSKQVLSPYKD